MATKRKLYPVKRPKAQIKRGEKALKEIRMIIRQAQLANLVKQYKLYI